MKTVRNYPLRIPETSARKIDRLCASGIVSFNQVVCLCVETGIDSVIARLSPQGRVTNVEPLPKETLEAYYARPDELDGVGAAALARFQSQETPS